MSARRKTLLSDAVAGGDRSKNTRPPGDPACQTREADGLHEAAPGHEPKPAEMRSHTAALRERLSQTRARIARAHSQPPPQIRVDWDVEEPPTRLYEGEPLASPAAPRASTPPVDDEAPAPPEHSPAPLPPRAPAPPELAPPDAWGAHPPTVAERAPAFTPRGDNAHRVPAVPEQAVGMVADNQVYAGLQASTPPVSARLDPPPPAAAVAGWPKHASPDAAGARARLGALQARWMRLDPVVRRSAGVGVGLLVLVAIAALWLRDAPTPSVRVDTTPNDARVTLDGQALSGAASPFTKRDLTPGEHELVIEKAGFVTQRRKLSVREGANPQQLSITLAPLPEKADVSISSVPAGATIFIDGRATGRVTPATLRALDLGRHLVSVKLDGYEHAQTALQLPADARLSFTLASQTREPVVESGADDQGPSRAEARAQARELARERRAAARAAKVLLRYRARMGLPPDPVAQELVDNYGSVHSAVP